MLRQIVRLCLMTRQSAEMIAVTATPRRGLYLCRAAPLPSVQCQTLAPSPSPSPATVPTPALNM